jgi:ABC-type methionine transport system ATPase subunit
VQGKARFCTCWERWTLQQAVKYTSAGIRSERFREKNWRNIATAPSGLCGSGTICCRILAENVAMPLLVQGEGLGQALRAAEEWLGEVGLGGRAGQQAGELSGGEQQRVAMARALVNRPAMLLADEPTGDLDERSAEEIFELMQRLHRSHQLTSILATHNLSLARRTDRVLTLEHGKLCSAESSGRVRVNRV